MTFQQWFDNNWYSNYFTIITVIVSGIIYKNQKGDWIHSGYAAAMKEFRKSFKYNIQRLSEEYQLTFSKEIPEEY